MKKGNAATAFKLKEKIVGMKKNSQEPTVIIDSKTQESITTPKGILKASLEYCTNLLTNRELKYNVLIQ